MYQFFTRPDAYLGRCGHLRYAVSTRHIPGAPAFLRGIRMLFVTDIHVLPRTADGDMRRFWDGLARLEPDILLMGGDYADDAEDARRLFAHKAGWDPPLGSYGVAGNNDTEAWDSLDALRDCMAQAGCALLVNRSEAIGLKGGTLWIAGVDDHYHGHPDCAGLYPQRDGRSWRVLLSHYPRPADPAPDMILSGHTHGGQFNLLGVTPYTLGFERILGKHPSPVVIAGLRRFHGTPMLVSRGVGSSRLHWRVGVRPEVELITFS